MGRLTIVPPKEAEVADALRALLDSRGWDTHTYQQGGSYHPSFIVRTPRGAPIVAELKTDPGVVHFSVVGQVAAYRNALSPSREPVLGVLLATGVVTPTIDALATELDVHVIIAPGNENAASIADSFAAELDKLAATIAEKQSHCVPPDTTPQPATEIQLDIASPIDAALSKLGYRLRIVAVDEEAVAIWLLETGGRVEAQIHDQALLYADGADEDAAIANVVELMRLYAGDVSAQSPDAVGPALPLTRFLQSRSREDGT